jgi:hypothetical protein
MLFLQTKNPNFGISEGDGNEGLMYFTLEFLRPFGVFYSHLVQTFPFWYVVPGKIWQPCFKTVSE